MPTWGEIKQEISDEYDLSEETFINEDGLLAWGNAGLADIEKEIHAIPDRDKYFQTEGPLPLVLAQSEYDLPTDIFANKIIEMWYNDGCRRYEIKPIRHLSEIQNVKPWDCYRYRIINHTTGKKLKFYPESQEDSASNVVMYYIRQVKKFTLDADVLDVPEGKNFLKQYVVDKAANKERMTPDAQESPALMKERQSLVQILENMIVDDNNEVEVDMSFYNHCV